jgi:Protein of unknown function (DUF3592)
MAKKKKKAEGWYNTLRNRIGHYVLGTVLIITGPVVALYSLRPVLEGRASTNWPTTKATITEAKLVETQRGPFESFEVKVGYTFVVDGKTFTGNRLKVGGKSSSKVADAEADMKRYGQLDAKMDVRYDPSDPTHSTLETGASNNDFLLTAVVGPLILVAGVFFVAIGGLMSLLAWKKAKADDSDDDDEEEEDRPKSKKAKRENDEDDEEAPPKKKRKADPIEDDEEDRPRKRK